MTRVCIVSYHQNTHDERAYWKMACSLQENNCQVTRLAVGDETMDYVDDKGIRIFQISLPKYSSNGLINFGFRFFFRKTRRRLLRKSLVNICADVYILYDFRTHYLAATIRNGQPKARILYDIVDPTIQQILDERPLPFGNKLWALYQTHSEKMALPLFHHIICTEPILAQKYRQKVPQTPVSIIHNYCNLLGCIKNDEPPFYDAIYCGLISPNRGLWQILEAGFILKKQSKEIKILLLGSLDSSINELEFANYLIKNGLQDIITWHKSVPHPEVGQFYNKSAIGLLTFIDVPANHQLLPVKLFEYLNFGLPIIAPNFGLMGAEVANNQVGICIDTSKPEQLAEAILTLRDDMVLYQTLKKKAHEIGLTKYNWSSEVPLLLDIVKAT